MVRYTGGIIRFMHIIVFQHMNDIIIRYLVYLTLKCWIPATYLILTYSSWTD